MAVPLISVLMPVWKPHPRHFPEAVASVVAQSMGDWELVIVEDPSECSAKELLAPFNDPRIRLITNSERTGLLAQRNRTLAEARAKWVAMLDADDVMEPERLAKQWSFIHDHSRVDVLGSQLTIFGGSGEKLGTRHYPESHQEIIAAFRRYNAIAQPATLARKSAMLQAGGYTFEFPVEDYDLWSRMAHSGATFANHPEALTRYRIGGATKSEKLRKTIRLTREVKRKYWWTQMTRKDRMRYRAEGMLRMLPAWVIERLFRKLTYSQ